MHYNKMRMKDSCDEFELLVKSANSLITCETVEEDRLRFLVRRTALQLNLPFYEWSVVKGFVQDGSHAKANTEDPTQALLMIQKHQGPGVFLLYDFMSHIDSPAMLRLLRETATGLRNSLSTMVVSGPDIKLSPELNHLAVPFRLKFPSEDELRELFRTVMDPLLQSKKSKLEITGDDIKSLIQALSGLTLRQARQILTYAALKDSALKTEDISLIVKRKGELVQESGILEFYPVDHNPVSVGGLRGLKEWLKTSRLTFSAEAKSMGLPMPRGILLVGVPGCGKSLSAKMIAKEWRQPLLRLDAARLFSKYIGDSEKNFKTAAEIAEAMAPSVLWIDEIEKLFSGISGSGSSSVDGGLSTRIFGALLTWLQEKHSEVFLVATANNLEQIPPELLRKGRFDEIFFVDLPTVEERREIFKLQLMTRKQDPGDFDLESLAQITKGYSGAEIEQLIVGALLKSIGEKNKLSTELLLKEAQGLIPLARSRAEEIEALRVLAKANFKNAS